MAEKEWTVMIFFAGDNALSPLIVSQLKAIKDAGFHQDVDVLVHFDSNEAGVPTRIFDVNRKRKNGTRGRRSKIGDGRDPFVRNMAEDTVDPKSIRGGPESASAGLRAALENRPDTSNAVDALKNFIGFCRENHSARNYILYVVGHGLVVGNDAFLPDDNPVSAITLEELREVLEGFTKAIKGDGVLQLLGLHSCSMSAIEVAYQLKGTARYMIGSEGIGFLEGFPYRQLLKKIFNFVDGPRERPQGGWRRRDDDGEEAEREERQANNPFAKDARLLIKKLYFLTLFNAADFMISGYSLDLCLCNLGTEENKENFDKLSLSIRQLVVGLKDALAQERGRELILLAHWESQSYWGESYTDLFDFCLCLRKRCRLALGLPDEYLDAERPEEAETDLGKLARACSDVMAQLERDRSGDFEKQYSRLVVHSCHFGPKYQYSHGLSIYFPWSRPLDDDPTNAFRRTRVFRDGKNVKEDDQGTMERYRGYRFNTELEKAAKGQSWGSFLDSYFDATRRKPRIEEDGQRVNKGDKSVSDEGDASLFGPLDLFGPVDRFGGTDNPFSVLTDEKPSARVGGGCTCPSIKNYENKITLSEIILRRTFRK